MPHLPPPPWAHYDHGGDPRLERAGHSTTAVDKHVYLCGGRRGKKFFQDLLRYDTETHCWETVMDHLPFEARANHSATLIERGLSGGRELWLIGGQTNDDVIAEVWVLELDCGFLWRPIHVRDDDALLLRTAHTAEVHPCDPTKILIFGGYGGRADAPGAFSFLSSLAVLDTTTGVAARLTPAGCPPSERAYHSWATVGAVGYVFGGRRHDGVVCDSDPTLLCAYDALQHAWLPLGAGCGVQGAPPCARSSHRAVAVAGRMVLFGGTAQDSPEEQMAAVHSLLITPGGNLVWSRCDDPGSSCAVRPAGRSAHGMAAVGGSAVAVVCGFGRTQKRQQYHKDVWVLHLDPAAPHRCPELQRVTSAERHPHCMQQQQQQQQQPARKRPRTPVAAGAELAAAVAAAHLEFCGSGLQEGDASPAVESAKRPRQQEGAAVGAGVASEGQAERGLGSSGGRGARRSAGDGTGDAHDPRSRPASEGASGGGGGPVAAATSAAREAAGGGASLGGSDGVAAPDAGESGAAEERLRREVEELQAALEAERSARTRSEAILREALGQLPYAAAGGALTVHAHGVEPADAAAALASALAAGREAEGKLRDDLEAERAESARLRAALDAAEGARPRGGGDADAQAEEGEVLEDSAGAAADEGAGALRREANDLRAALEAAQQQLERHQAVAAAAGSQCEEAAEQLRAGLAREAELQRELSELKAAKARAGEALLSAQGERDEQCRRADAAVADAAREAEARAAADARAAGADARAAEADARAAAADARAAEAAEAAGARAEELERRLLKAEQQAAQHESESERLRADALGARSEAGAAGASAAEARAAAEGAEVAVAVVREEAGRLQEELLRAEATAAEAEQRAASLSAAAEGAAQQAAQARAAWDEERSELERARAAADAAAGCARARADEAEARAAAAEASAAAAAQQSSAGIQALRARCGALGARASRFRAEAGALRGRVEAAAPEFEETVRKALAVLLSAVQHDPLEEGDEPNDSGQKEDEPEEAGAALEGAATGAAARAGGP